MSSTEENGTEHDEVDDRFEEVLREVGTADLSKPPMLRRTMLQIVELNHESFKAARYASFQVKSMRSEVAVRDNDIQRSLARIEDVQERSWALQQATAVRVHRLDQERELPVERLGQVKQDMDNMRRQLGQHDQKLATQRREFIDRFLAGEKRLDEIEDDVEVTGQKVVGELALAPHRQELAVARAKFESITEITKAQLQGTDTEKRETKKWALGLFGSILLIIVSTVLTYAATQILGKPASSVPAAPK